MSVMADAPVRARVPSRRRARRAPTIVLAVAAVAAAVGAVVAAGSGSGGGVAASTSRTVTVERGVIQSTVSGSGALTARHDRELAFTTAGTIKKVFVGVGDRVAKGQVLARLKTSAGTTKHLRAPFAGTIGSVGIAAGDLSGDTTTAFELVSLKSYDMTVALSESDIGKVKQGQSATVTVSATGDVLAARVAHLSLLPTTSSSTDAAGGSSASSSAATYAVTLELTQATRALKPGMAASADIVTSEATGLTLPTAALHGKQVTVLRNGKRSTVAVRTGVVGDSATQIVSGLAAGEQVVETSTTATASAARATGGGR